MKKVRSFWGAFTRLMKEHPAIEKLIMDLLMKSKPPLPTTQIHQKMLQALRAEGFQDTDYPFDKFDLGLRDLYCYQKKYEDLIFQGVGCKPKFSDKSPPALPSVSKDVATLTKRIVRGDIRRGRRPYVCFEGNHYMSRALSQTPSLINKEITVAFDPSDIRTISAYGESGQFLDNLTCCRLSGFGHPVSLGFQRNAMRERRRPIELDDASITEFLADHKINWISFRTRKEIARQVGLKDRYTLKMIF